MEIKAAFGAVKAFCSKHATAISAVTSIVCYAGAIVSAISETRAFDARIEELKIANDGKPIEKKAIVKTAVRSYWLTAMIYGVATTANIMGLRAANRRAVGLAMELSQLSAAHKITEKAFRNYKEAVKKTVSEKKNEEIEAKADQIMVDKANINTQELLENPFHGKYPFMDRWTGRLFWGHEDQIRAAFDEVEDLYERGEDVSCKDFLEAWGLETWNDRQYGDTINGNMGWRYDYLGEPLKFAITSANVKIGSEVIPVNVVGSRQPPHCYISM